MSKRMRGAVGWLGLSVVLVGASGCGVAGGFLRDSMTQVQVHGPGFRIVKENLTATATVTTALCQIPIEDTPYTRLVRQLNEKASLGRNQMLVNFREDRSFRYYLFFMCIQEYTLSADVIEFQTPKREARSEE